MKDQKPRSIEEIETRSDGWDRFKTAVHAAAKSGPKHRTKDEAPAKRSVVKDERKR